MFCTLFSVCVWFDMPVLLFFNAVLRYNIRMTMRKSQKFFYSCLVFLLGVGLAEYVPLSGTVILVLIGAVAVGLIFWKQKRLALVFVLFFLFGFLRLHLAQPNINANHISFYNEQNKSFEAVIAEEPDARIAEQRLTVKPVDFKGKVLLKTALFPEYHYGDRLSVECKLLTPQAVEDFQYDRYLARYGIYSVCYIPKIKLIAGEQKNFLVSGIYKFKSAFARRINQTISEPHAALLAGILIGSRQGIPTDVSETFKDVGITHIIAISGYNITIIVAMLMGVFAALRVNRKKAFWGIVAGLIFFVILTGASASVVRAAVMGFIVLLAKQMGRASKVKNILILSAAAMVFVNPRILLWDAGFQLSFLATLGLIYLGPILQKRLTKLPEAFGLQENLASTLSAIIFTLPIILFNFHRFSLVAPLVNILVLPAIPWIMLVGFVQVVAAFIWLPLGQVVGWGSWALISYVVKIAQIFS